MSFKTKKLRITNDEQYPFNPSWIKSFKVRDIDFWDEINDTPMGRLGVYEQMRVMNIKKSSETRLVKNIEFNLQGNVLKRIVWFFKNFGAQWSRLKLKKNKYRIRKKLLSTNFDFKKDFFSEWEIMKININVIFANGKKISININSITKDPQLITNPIITLYQINSIDISLIQSLKMQHKISSIAKIVIKKNLSFLKSLVKEKIFSIEKVLKDDARVCDLMKRCYQLITIVDTKVEIPHSFSDYWIFVLNLNESIQDFLTGNISSQQDYTLTENTP